MPFESSGEVVVVPMQFGHHWERLSSQWVVWVETDCLMNMIHPFFFLSWGRNYSMAHDFLAVLRCGHGGQALSAFLEFLYKGTFSVKKAAAWIVNAAVVTMTDHKEGRQYLHQVLVGKSDNWSNCLPETNLLRWKIVYRYWGGPLLGRNSAHLSNHRNQHLKDRSHRWLVIIAPWLFLRSYQVTKLNSFLLANPTFRRCVGFARVRQDSATKDVKTDTKKTVVKPMFPVLSQASRPTHQDTKTKLSKARTQFDKAIHC